MSKIPIALQLYSVRNDAQADLFGVLKQVAKMGYEGVEFAGYYGHEAKEIRKALDDLGLKAEGTHTPIDALNDENINATIDLHKTLGAEFCIVPWIPESMRNSPEAAKATGEKMTVICAKLKAVGLKTGFHAHDGDMKILEGGKSAWAILAESTPAEFIMQYDTANGMAGGADPVIPILDNPGRNLSVHLKGYKGGHGGIIGEDDIPWARVFEACENGGGVQWYVVEHEVETDPALEAVDKCLKNLRAMGK
jgi:sugar phosphate isomerase/epimerase